MTHEQYQDEPCDVIDWTLRMAEARGDEPWRQERGKGGGRGDPRSA